MSDFSLENLIPKDSVLSPVFCYSKKRAFEIICKQASININIPEDELLAIIQERESLGSTYLANGVAIPHVFVPEKIKETIIIIILDTPVQHDEYNNSVDIYISLFLHESTLEEHGVIIDKLFESFKDTNFIKHLRTVANIPSQIKASIVSMYNALAQEYNKEIEELNADENDDLIVLRTDKVEVAFIPNISNSN